MKKYTNAAALLLSLLIIIGLCGCDASLERTIEGSWKSGEGYVFTFDGVMLNVTDVNGENMVDAELKYEAKNGILRIYIEDKFIDMFYYQIYADTLRLEYTEPVLEFLGEDVQAEFTDKVMVLERIC